MNLDSEADGASRAAQRSSAAMKAGFLAFAAAVANKSPEDMGGSIRKVEPPIVRERFSQGRKRIHGGFPLLAVMPASVHSCLE